MKALLVVLLALLVCLPAKADPRLPAWLRLVDREGQVFDIEILILDGITVCPTAGSADLWSHDDGEGVALIDTAYGQLQWAYERKLYNEGAVTSNPDTTGDQVVLLEAVDRVFAGGMEACTRYGAAVQP